MDNEIRKLRNVLKQMTLLMKKQRPVLPEGIKSLTLAQVQVIEYLCENKKARMSDIAKEAGVKLPTMTEIVDKLVRQGFLKRQREEKDRRAVWVTIAPHVEKFAVEMKNKHEKYIEGIMSVLTRTEKKNAIKIISKLIQKIKKDDNVAGGWNG